MSELIGGALIFIACAATGFITAKLYRLRVKQLEAFIKLIAHIHAQIEYYCSPLDMIFEGYKSEPLESFIAEARLRGAAEAFGICRKRLYISDSDADALSKFFDGLGRHNAGEEISHCAYFEKQLGDALASASAELPKKMKLCRTFGLLAGFLAAILLI